MRIAVIDLLFNWPPDGGARTDVKEVFSRLSQQHEVRMFVPKHNNVLPRGHIEGDVGINIETISFNVYTFNFLTIIHRFQNALDQFKPDIVFVTDGWYLKPWAAYAARHYPTIIRFYAYECLCLRFHGVFMRGIFSCYRSHLGNLFLDYPYCNACALKTLMRETFARKKPDSLMEYIGALTWSPIYRKITKRMLRKANHIIVYNEFMKKTLSPYNENIHVTPGGICPEDFPVQSYRTSKPIRIGMVGRTGDENKGYTFLRKAVLQLIKEDFDVELWLTGSRDKYLPEIPCVKFKGWYKPENLIDFYSDVDICVVPSCWQEPFGIVAAEAMAVGKPVIVTKVGGLQNIIEHGKTGLIVPARSSEQLAKALATLIKDPELRHRMGKTGSKIVRQRYSWDKIVEKHYIPLLSSGIK